eukprot:jgi/Botrbrau1/7487/Bobra.0095s0023.1
MFQRRTPKSFRASRESIKLISFSFSLELSSTWGTVLGHTQSLRTLCIGAICTYLGARTDAILNCFSLTFPQAT